ncbi:MAG TPA: PD-(D/E)XK nuclease family protein [Solirubrobacterales bacterium]|nr:PD-(D/E)XK nuclease family protein [Solirubrobacterales bacterium]
MSLKLIQGPPNSGRAGRIQELFRDALDRNPVLVLPTRDDVYRFERLLCGAGAALGGSVLTFDDLFREVARATGAPQAGELTPAQRLGAISAAISACGGTLGPLRRSAARPSFAIPFERLLDELQGAGLDPEALGSGANTLESSAYLGDLTALFGAYAELRDRLGLRDVHGLARAAVESLQAAPRAWGGRPVFFYEPGEPSGNQRALLAALSAATEVTVALAHEEGNPALAARGASAERLGELATARETTSGPQQLEPFDIDPLLVHLQREFARPEPARRAPGKALVLLRSAGARGEAEAIGEQATKLIGAGADPAAIAIAVRDPVRRGPLLGAVLEAHGIAVALEAEVPVAATSVGGTLIALLEAELGTGRAADLLRFLRGPSGVSAGRVDWFERAVRRRRLQSAEAALALWEERYERLPADLHAVREATAAGPAPLAATAARLATTMASRPLRGDGDGPMPQRGDGSELRAAAAISTALGDLAELPELAPRPAGLISTLRELRFNAWSGPVEGRVRIASPYRLRASRFEHVFVASLQDGEFPRRDRGEDPFLAEAQRLALGLEPRRDPEEEERYLFHACLALPSKSLFLSYRDSDEDGVAEARSPFLDDVRDLLDPAPEAGEPDPVEEELTIARDLARAGLPPGRAPSQADLERARKAEAASRAPGPIANPAVLAALAAVPAYGGTTLEGFDVCSYRWFVSHELDPQALDPAPDPLVQGGLMHAALERLYSERPGGDSLPRPRSLAAWAARARQIVGEIAAGRELGGHPAERAIVRRVEALLVRFLEDEVARADDGFQPWLLEAAFGEDEGAERPVLEIDGWGLHGAIDRVDRDAAGRALVLDYKLSRTVTPLGKFEEQAKLQLQLYMIAVAEHWGADAAGGLYHPLRGTSRDSRRPRGTLREDAAAQLGSYAIYDNDVLDREGFEQMLDEARRRAGEIVARMRHGDIRRDPGPRRGLRGHDVCPAFCEFAPICRRDRAPTQAEDYEWEER